MFYDVCLVAIKINYLKGRHWESASFISLLIERRAEKRKSDGQDFDGSLEGGYACSRLLDSVLVQNRVMGPPALGLLMIVQVIYKKKYTDVNRKPY